MTRPRASRATDVTKGLGALAAVAALAAGVPAGLWAAVGWPLSRNVPGWSDVARALRDTYVPDEFIINALAVVCWLAWAQLIAALAVEAVAAIRRRPAIRVPLAGPLQTAAAHLVAAVLLLGALTGPRPAAAAPPPLRTVELVAADPAAALSAPPPAVTPATSDTNGTPAPATGPVPLPTYTVQRFDDLWSIAERHLADPYRWTDIWDLNRGRSFDGATFRDPDLIHPGWTLHLPADATGVTPPPRPVQEPETPSRTDTSVGDEPMDEPRDASRNNFINPTPDGSDFDQECPAPAESDAVPAITPPPANSPSAPAATDRPTSPADTPSDKPASGPLTDLPSGAAVGLALATAASAALAAARLHRRRRHLPDDPRPGIAHRDPLAPAVVRRLRRADLARHDPTADRDGLADSPSTPTAGTAELPGRSLKPDLARLGTLCLTGPGAADTTRAVLTTFLLADAPTAAGRVNIAGIQTAELLLPGVASLPDLVIADTIDDALTDLEVDLITRTRLLDTFDIDDFVAFADRHPEQPVPAILLIARPPDPSARQRLDAIARLGCRLGINAILLGSTDAWPTVTVDAAGTVTDVQPAEERTGLAGRRLDTLTAADTAALLATAAAARDVPISAESREMIAEDFTAPPPPDATRPITVRLLGPLTISAESEEIRTGLRSKARELLAYFLLHPDGATLEAAVDTLWPDADPTRGVERFRTVLGNLRSTLRAATGIEQAAIIDRVGERYQADATLIDCDLWRFENALTDAAAATEPAAAGEALERATAAYGGDLCDGAYYEWVEAAREDLRRRAVDASARLAELRHASGDGDGALDALEQAVRHDPYTEELYRRIMRLQADLGRPDAVRRTYRLLETRLTDLDIEPDSLTDQLLADLLGATTDPTNKQIHNTRANA